MPRNNATAHDVRSLPAVSFGRMVMALALFFTAFGAVATVARFAGGDSWVGPSASALSVVVMCGLAGLGLLTLVLRRGHEVLPVGLIAAWVGIWGFAAWNAVAGRVALVGYGDVGFLAGRLEQQGGLFPRWLAGNAVLEWLYVAVWRSPFLTGIVPAGRPGTSLFIAVSGASVMAACAIAVILIGWRRFPLAVVLTTFSPIFVMLALGYDEIYPMVAGPFLLALFWLFSRPLEQADGVAVGATLGVLAILYVPLAPFSAVAAVTIALMVPHRARSLLATGTATVVGGIVVCWPHGVSHFFRSLYMTLNLGDSNTFFERYMGHAAGPRSFTFAWPYALSVEHLRDLGLMWFWSGTLPILGAAVSAAAVVWWLQRRGRSGPGAGMTLDRRVWLALAIAAQQGWWALLMIPKLGPRQDVDLFFSAYLTAAFLVGTLLDRLVGRSASRSRNVLFVSAAALGAAAASLAFLAVGGIPAVR